MAIAISPRHMVVDNFLPQDQWPLDLKIDVFLARIDGWHLEVADRCINGWEDVEGKESINSLLENRSLLMSGNSILREQQQMIPWHQIPHAGWAVLQIVFNYFQIVGLFKFFNHPDAKDSFKLITLGVKDVFPGLQQYGEAPARVIYELRNQLYHIGVKGAKIYISGQLPEPVIYDPEASQIKINPHSFVRVLRQHLNSYGMSLRNPAETELRAKFEAAFEFYYLG
jgi:hypothetical protein